MTLSCEHRRTFVERNLLSVLRNFAGMEAITFDVPLSEVVFYLKCRIQYGPCVPGECPQMKREGA